MHLLAPLAAGINGAALGTARLYNRGTTTRATWYSDFEASNAGSTADIALDSNGGAIVYVNGLVEVVVIKSGVEVRRFVAGSSAASTELISTSVSGVDYEDLSTGANRPTTVKAAFDLWYALAGSAAFGYVNPFGTGAIAIGTAIGLGQNGEFSVKKYGALGDGTTNDTAAVSAAFSAASAAGGGTVVFPPGTYRITSAISVAAKVSIRGCGAGSIVAIDSASANTFSFASSAIMRCVESIAIVPAQNNTGELLDTGGTANIRCYAVVFGSSSTTTFLGNIGSSASANAEYHLTGCRVYHGGGTANILPNFAGTMSATFLTLAGSAAWTATMITPSRLAISGCVFDFSTMTSGTVTGFTHGAGDNVSISGCHFIGPTSGTLVVFDIPNSAYTFSESGNAFSGTLTAYSMADIGTAVTASLGSRSLRKLQVDNDTAGAQTVDTLNYGTIVWRRTNNGTQTPTFAIAPEGTRFTLVWWNDHGAGGGTITLASVVGAVRSEFASEQFTVAANSMRQMSFIVTVLNSNLRWVQDGESTDDETE